MNSIAAARRKNNPQNTFAMLENVNYLSEWSVTAIFVVLFCIFTFSTFHMDRFDAC